MGATTMAYKVDGGISRAGPAFVVLLHAVAFWALLRMEVLSLPAPLAVLDVRLLTPPAPPAARPEVVPPRPRPIERPPAPRPARAAVPLAVPAEAPAQL